MTKAFRDLRERNGYVDFFATIQETLFYPILFALLCLFSSMGGKNIYVPLFWLMCVTVVFGACFTKDNKIFLTPMIMIYYGLGQDRTHQFLGKAGEVLVPFDADGLRQLYQCGAVMIVAILLRFALDGTLLRVFKRRGICLWGILAMGVAFLCNGTLSKTYVPQNLLFGAFFIMGIAVFYTVVLSMLESSREPIRYGCQVLVCNSYLVLLQVLLRFRHRWADHSMFVQSEDGIILSVNRMELQFSWGLPTIIGAVLVLGIPAAMYLARTRRCAGLSYASALLFLAGSFLVGTRSSFFAGALTFVICAVLCCVGGKNRLANRIYTLLLIVAACVAMLWVQRNVIPLEELWNRAISFLRFDNIIDTHRISFWKNGWQDFLRSPLFGSGFSDGAYDILRPDKNIFSRMYHNIGIEILGAMGIVGLVAFLWHLRHVCELLLRRFTADKLMLLMPSLMILGMSLVDNFFFYLNFQIIYAVFLALTEHELERLRKDRLADHRRVEPEKKPRVVFTYVEAGKGHIVPERAVCHAFRAAYGDSAEIVESAFYTETGNPDLEATERLFAKAVKQQNKNGILSALCRAGNLLCGDCFALYFLMTQTISGRRSRRLAMKHLEELKADVLFTTHWSTAFYANRLKKNRPYVVCLCPDAYSNGMFNVDVNQFLIPSKSGLRRAQRRRMYAGGTLHEVPFPIRPEAYELLDKKQELRASLGIGEQDFVVTLSDGGYGMARLEQTVCALLRSDVPMTLIALCGTNKVLYERLSALPPSPIVRLIPVPFTDAPLPYIAVADLFCGKSGANSMAEPAFFGVPILITKCITYIEKDIKRYYTRTVKGALYLPSARRSVKKILSFAEHPEERIPYREALARLDRAHGAEEIARLLWEACAHTHS